MDEYSSTTTCQKRGRPLLEVAGAWICLVVSAGVAAPSRMMMTHHRRLTTSTCLQLRVVAPPQRVVAPPQKEPTHLRSWLEEVEEMHSLSLSWVVLSPPSQLAVSPPSQLAVSGTVAPDGTSACPPCSNAVFLRWVCFSGNEPAALLTPPLSLLDSLGGGFQASQTSRIRRWWVVAFHSCSCRSSRIRRCVVSFHACS